MRARACRDTREARADGAAERAQSVGGGEGCAVAPCGGRAGDCVGVFDSSEFRQALSSSLERAERRRQAVKDELEAAEREYMRRFEAGTLIPKKVRPAGKVVVSG